MEIINREMIDYVVADHSLSEILNYNEFAVLREMRAIYERDRSLCRCTLCLEDIFALSLNSLPPRYIQNTSVRTYEESQSFIPVQQVRTKVEEAVAKVKAQPNH